jgi:serine protease Do
MRKGVVLLFALAFFSLTARSDERLDMRRDPVVKAVEKASPAVVNISTEKVVQRGFFFGGDSPFNDPLFEDFMREFGRPEIANSLGSGGIFSPDGYIFTNAHVVDRASKIVVTLRDNTQHEATLVNVDVSSDLAVIKIDADKPLPTLVFGRSDDLLVGEPAVAVGNPFGLSDSVTVGVISALHRDIVAEGRAVFRDILQTDALMNPGNSGGPLLNVFGEVIGVTSAMKADAQGIGFAIPVDRVKTSLTELLDHRKLLRIRLGLSLEDEYTGSGPETRVVVKSVEKGSPAERAGFADGDVILAANDRKIADVVDYMVAVLAAAGRPVRITASRGASEVTATVAPAAIPKPDGVKLASDLLGLSVQQMTKALGRDVGINLDRGILVSDVKKGSPGEIGEVQRGDIVYQVNDTYTADMDSFAAALEAARGSKALRLDFIRVDGRTVYRFRTRLPFNP